MPETEDEKIESGLRKVFPRGIARIEKKARIATLEEVLTGLRSEDDTTQVRAIINTIENLRDDFS